jgi:hypothetical protein
MENLPFRFLKIEGFQFWLHILNGTQSLVPVRFLGGAGGGFRFQFQFQFWQPEPVPVQFQVTGSRIAINYQLTSGSPLGRFQTFFPNSNAGSKTRSGFGSRLKLGSVLDPIPVPEPDPLPVQLLLTRPGSNLVSSNKTRFWSGSY